MNLFIVTTQPGGRHTSNVGMWMWMRANSMDLPDRHVVKMILESAQIVMTALHIKAVEQYHPGAAAVLSVAGQLDMPMPLFGGHRKHPAIKWAADSRDNTMTHIAFVLVNAMQLCDEYTARYKKVHTYTLALHMLTQAPEIQASNFTLPHYLPLCANSAWDTKVTGNYINITPAGVDLIVALQRRNFILNKPWIADNYKRAAFVPHWVKHAFHADSAMHVAALDSITDRIRRNNQYATFTPAAD